MRAVDLVYQDHIETEWPPHTHAWQSTRHFVGCVGQLYPNVYPYACACGALKKHDGTVLPARLS